MRTSAAAAAAAIAPRTAPGFTGRTCMHYATANNNFDWVNMVLASVALGGISMANAVSCSALVHLGHVTWGHTLPCS